MKHFVFVSILLLTFLLVPLRHVRAAHILPYPSFMPGNKLYRITRAFDRLKWYWQYGSIGRYKYHISLSDKYLVEAKTLFEYEQYLLAVDALRRSDAEYGKIPSYLRRGKREGKDMHTFERDFSDALIAHKRILSALIAGVPEQILWSPEKSAPTDLPLRAIITESISIRDQTHKLLEDNP